MSLFQLGNVTQAEAELTICREMVEKRFRNKLELGDNKTGRLGGWIMARIFLREAKVYRRIFKVWKNHDSLKKCRSGQLH